MGDNSRGRSRHHSREQTLPIRIVLDFDHNLMPLRYILPDHIGRVQNKQIHLDRVRAVVGEINEDIRVEIVVIGLLEARPYVRVSNRLEYIYKYLCRLEWG